MATLKAKIQEDLKAALKEGREAELSVLRMLMAAASSRETEKRTKLWKAKPDLATKDLEKESQLTDEELLGVISSEIKKRREALLLFEKGKREDLAKKEKAEMEILERYLPEQLPEEEIRELVKEAVAAYRASLAPPEREKVGMKDMGKIMAELMPKVKGKADGSVVSNIAKEILN